MLLQFIIIFTISILMFLVGLLIPALMFNKLYFKKKISTIISYAAIFNILYFLGLIFSRVYSTELQRILYYYLGILLFAFTVGTIFWILYGILKTLKKENLLFKKQIKHIPIAIIVLLTLVSIYNFEKPMAVEEFIIPSNKVSQEYTFVQVTDIQFGTTSKEYMDYTMNLAMEQNPDFIVFTGDLIDFDFYEIEDFEIFRTIDIPIYFERGNHEFYHFQQKLMFILEGIPSIEMLINQKTSFEELDIIGIDYSRSETQLKDELQNIEINHSRFSILLFHEPKGLEPAIEKGIDLMLFGHVHGGQIFPITLLTDYLYYPYANGYMEVEDSILYTSDGAGLWGPKMRLGSQNEIAVFKILPE